jgi:hypothetical protein
MCPAVGALVSASLSFSNRMAVLAMRQPVNRFLWEAK